MNYIINIGDVVALLDETRQIKYNVEISASGFPPPGSRILAGLKVHPLSDEEIDNLEEFSYSRPLNNRIEVDTATETYCLGRYNSEDKIWARVSIGEGSYEWLIFSCAKPNLEVKMKVVADYDSSEDVDDDEFDPLDSEDELNDGYYEIEGE